MGTTKASTNQVLHDHMIVRVADFYMEAEDLPEQPRTRRRRTKKKKIERLLSQPVSTKLFQTFGVRGMEFFDLYFTIFEYARTKQPLEQSLVQTFRASSRVVFKDLVYESSKNKFNNLAQELRPLLARLDTGRFNVRTVRQVSQLYVALMKAVASDRDVFMKTRIIEPKGQWMFFSVMSERESKLERLKRDDPELYDSIQKSRGVLKKLDEEIEKTVIADGKEPGRKSIMGQLVVTGTDPVTDELYVYTKDGDVLTVSDFVEQRKETLKAKRRAERVFPENLDDLRKVSDFRLKRYMEGEVEYVAITDDKAKADAVTRIYPVQRLKGEKVVVAGRFKGIYLNDLVHSTGRMVEGVAYDFDHKTGRPIKMETKNRDGSINVRVTREPYVTLTPDGRLFVKVPSTRDYTKHRNALFDLQKVVPSMTYAEGTRRGGYYFEAKDFAAVREALKGMSCSQAAMGHMQEYFTKLAKHELATSAENLKNYTTEAIGGFRPKIELFNKQKECLAWLESRGWNGVGALDTGVGKTITTVAAIQKMDRDGLTEEGNGKFLYVCPAGLVGNLPKEIYAFIEDPEPLMKKVVILSYAKFSREMKKNKNFAKKFVAIFFDEAQALKNHTSGRSKMVQQTDHPRKILLSASPMERSPMEVYVLAMIGNNENINTKEGRAKMRAFKKRFCEEVGGRIVGMKTDPVTARDLRVWVKQNLFFADKRDVEEIALPQLRQANPTVTMDPEIEAKYKEATDGVRRVMRGLVAKYRDRSTKATSPAIEAAKFKLRSLFKDLYRLANMPETVIPGASNPKMDQSVQIIEERLSSRSRTILWCDSPEMAEHTVKSLCTRFPGKFHAVGFSDRIEVWKNGKLAETFRKKVYTTEEREFPASEWKVYVLKYVIQPNRKVLTLTLTDSYSVGQNLQAFDTVIHLDRDSWNSELMKQRTARAWRSGQKNSVHEYTLDTVFTEVDDPRDETVDRIMAAMQQLEGELFDQVVIESQAEALGKEFFSMQRTDASFFQLDRRMMELAMSPYAKKIGLSEAS